MTKDGLSETGKARPDYFVCTPLRSGTYRFIYWGVVPEKQREEDTDYALGTQFTVTEG